MEEKSRPRRAPGNGAAFRVLARSNFTPYKLPFRVLLRRWERAVHEGRRSPNKLHQGRNQ